MYLVDFNCPVRVTAPELHKLVEITGCGRAGCPGDADVFSRAQVSFETGWAFAHHAGNGLLLAFVNSGRARKRKRIFWNFRSKRGTRRRLIACISEGMPPKEIASAEGDALGSITTIAALLFLAERFPHRQFNSAELSIVSGIGRTAMSQIKNAADTPFSLGKCTMARLDRWLARHPGFKRP
jgi:hypothetical protein